METNITQKIDQGILAWDESFAQIATRLGIEKAQIWLRWRTYFAPEARRMITEGFSNDQIKANLGLPTSAIAAFRAAATRKLNGPVEELNEDDTDAIEVRIGYERDLQAALRERIEHLEPGLKIVDGHKEFHTEAGRIDILARDKNEQLVVIELKRGNAGREAVGQIIGYMGALAAEEGKAVRGILVAAGFDKEVAHASKVIPQLKLAEYHLNFSFKKAG